MPNSRYTGRDTSPQVLAQNLGVEEHACSGQGMVVCGFPLSQYDPVHPPLMEETQAIPIGFDAFVPSFLVCKVSHVLSEVCLLREAITVNADQAGIHAALHLLRTSVLLSVHHLLRSLSVLATRAGAQELDAKWHDLLCRLTHFSGRHDLGSCSHSPCFW